MGRVKPCMIHLMQSHQREFIEFALAQGALCFGKFTLKSGRRSPYFFDAGRFDTGPALAKLGQYFATAIQTAKLDFDMLFGPAYKGIPLAASCAIALAEHHNRDVPFCFNRKEAKDHGEGGQLIGAPLEGRILIIDDVISAGTAVRGSTQIIKQEGATLAGVVIVLDRQEQGTSQLSAIQEVEQTFGIPVINIVALTHLIRFLEQQPNMAVHLDAICQYQSKYGID